MCIEVHVAGKFSWLRVAYGDGAVDTLNGKFFKPGKFLCKHAYKPGSYVAKVTLMSDVRKSRDVEVISA